MNELLIGDCRATLAGVAAGSVQTCITSPPYYAKRDYQTEPQIWGGDPACEHAWGAAGKSGQRLRNGSGSDTAKVAMPETLHPSTGTFCTRCGAWRGELGSEPTVALYVAHLVEVFRAVKRVLRPDGTLWLNLATSYNSGIIETEDYVLRDDLTSEELAYVYAELGQHFITQSQTLSSMRATAPSPEQDVSRVLSRKERTPRKLPNEGV